VDEIRYVKDNMTRVDQDRVHWKLLLLALMDVLVITVP